MDFERNCADDASCLRRLVARLYPDGVHCPKCDSVTPPYRGKSRTWHKCHFYGHQEYPLVGTIFDGPATSLRPRFYAMFLMTSSRRRLSAKRLGVASLQAEAAAKMGEILHARLKKVLASG